MQGQLQFSKGLMMEALLNLLKGAAPMLATAVAGPLGGAAVSMIASKLGVEDAVDAVAAAIASDPAAIEKLKELDLEFAKVDAANTADARDMQKVALGQDDLVAKRFIYQFAWFWSAASVAYFFGITFIDVSIGSRDFANIILGFLLGTAIASIFNFFYGSSKSSQDKSTKLAARSDFSDKQ